MKAVRFWIEICKRLVDAWDIVSTDLGYSPFANKQKDAQIKPEVKK